MYKSKTLCTSKLERTQFESMEQWLLSASSASPAAYYHIQSGGSRTRAKLCIATCNALDLPLDTTLALSTCVELLHNASLIHDDLQDGDEVRRGRPSVWKRFGKAIALCAGDLMLSNAYGILSKVEEISKLPILICRVSEYVSLTIEGQCQDIHQHCKTLAEYESIAAKKSGPLLQLALCLPLLTIGDNNAAKTASLALRNFAVAYQIIDDLSDWQSDESTGQLNIVNLLARESGKEQAFSLARARAQYLLKRCETELATLPCDSGHAAQNACQQLFSKVCRSQYE